MGHKALKVGPQRIDEGATHRARVLSMSSIGGICGTLDHVPLTS